MSAVRPGSRLAISSASRVLPEHAGSHDGDQTVAREQALDLGELGLTPDQARSRLARRLQFDDIASGRRCDDLPRRRVRCRQRGGVVGEDRLMQVAQLRARLETELVDQSLANGAVVLERVRLTSRAVQREEPERLQVLAQRMLARRVRPARRRPRRHGRRRCPLRSRSPWPASEAPRGGRSQSPQTARRRRRRAPGRATVPARRAAAPAASSRSKRTRSTASSCRRSS